MLYPLAVVSALVLTLYTVFSDPRVQTLVARMVTDELSRDWKTEVRMGGFDFSLSKGVIISDVLVRDLHDTVLLSADRIAVQLSFRQLFEKNLHINKVLIENGQFQLITHKGDSVLNLQFILDKLSSKGKAPKPIDTTTTQNWNISGASVQLKNFRFHFQDENSPPVPQGMDYANIDVRNINLRLSGLSLEGDTINAAINSLMAKERSGFELLSFSGEFRVSSRFLKARNLKILTSHSDLQLDFEFNYDHWAAYNDFLNKVRITGNIQPSLFNLTDIGYFAPVVASMKDPMRIEGVVDGTVANFTAKNFKVAFGNTTMFDGDVMAIGLPDVYSTYVDLNIRNLVTDNADILSFRLPDEAGGIPVPEQLSILGTMSVKGRFTGYYDNFTANVATVTAIGDATANLVLKTSGPSKTLAYSGDLAANSLDLGKLAGSALVGAVTFRGTVNGSGTRLDNADITMNLQVDTISLYHYRYRNLNINGTLSDKTFDGLLSVRDPHLWLDFSGRADFHDSLPSFDFSAFLHKAHLFELQLVQRDSLEHVSGEIYAHFTGSNIDNMEGLIRLNDVVFNEGKQAATMENFLVKTSRDLQGNKSFHLESDFLNADVIGVFSFSSLITSARLFVNNYLAHFSLKDSLVVKYTAEPQFLRYSVEFNDTRELTDIFMPFLNIAPGTLLNGNFDTERELFRMEGTSPKLTVYGLDVEDFYLEAETGIKELTVHAGCRNFYLVRPKGTDSLTILLDSLRLVSRMSRDSIHYDVRWGARSGQSLLNGFLCFNADESVKVRMDQFSVHVRDKLWEITPDNYVILDSTGIQFHNVAFVSGTEGFRFNGKISHNVKDTLEATFNHFNISDVDELIANKNIDVDGILNGKVKVADLYREYSIFSNLHLDSLSFNKEFLGDAVVGVTYNKSASQFDVDAQIIYTGNIGQNIPLSFKGSYFLGKPVPHFDFDIALKNLNLKMLQPFLSSFMSGLTGLVSGEAKLTGTLEKPELTGELRVMRTEFRINYLNVPYSFSDVVAIEKNRFVFNNITLYDSLGHKSVLNGEITHKNFSDLRLNLNIAVNNFSAFHNTVAQNNVFYGHARASGNVSITGPIDDISIDVRAATGPTTHVVIPINLTADVSEMDYIVFEEPKKEDTGAAPARKPRGPAKGLSLYLNLAVNPEAEVEVFFPDQLGNIAGSGIGNLTMTMTPTTPFTITGNYMITKGSFLLQLKNLLRLPFTISPGSEVIWTGDPANADISLSAIYKTKVPLAGLTSNPEVASMRVPVQVILRLKGKLTNPAITFGMATPDAEESAQTIIYNSIDTNNQEVMAAQMLSILVINQFQAVGSGSTEVNVAGSSFSLVTNQINSKLSSLTKNVNVNVNYTPGTSTVGQEFDVGLSTQFLNDRLLVDGTFGMASYKNTTVNQANTIVGDINIQYVLTKNRRWRIRAFNKTNTISILENNAPYTQGVGISYQRDFTKFRDLFGGKQKKKVQGEKQIVN